MPRPSFSEFIPGAEPGKKFKCPFHDDGTPSAVIYLNGKEHMHCFGCGWHGDVYDYLAVVRGVPLKEILSEYEPRNIARYELRPWRGKEAYRAGEIERTREILADMGKIALVQNDCFVNYGVKAAADGSVIYVPLERGLFARRFRDKKPKWIGPKGKSGGWYLPAQSDTIVIVEGYFDAMAVNSAGFACAALCGTNVRNFPHIAAQNKRIVVFPDNDAPGKAVVSGMLDYGEVFYVAKCERDADEYTHSEIKNIVDSAVPVWEWFAENEPVRRDVIEKLLEIMSGNLGSGAAERVLAEIYLGKMGVLRERP